MAEPDLSVMMSELYQEIGTSILASRSVCGVKIVSHVFSSRDKRHQEPEFRVASSTFYGFIG